MDDEGELAWKSDIICLMDEFKHILLSLADEFAAKPRAHEAWPALADLFNYFIQWADNPYSLISGCRQLSETALRWAKDALSSMQGLASDIQDALMAKVGKLRVFLCSS